MLSLCIVTELVKMDLISDTILQSGFVHNRFRDIICMLYSKVMLH